VTRSARLIRSSILLTCLYYLIDDWRARLRLAKGRIETRSGARHAALDAQASIAYIEHVWNDYRRYSDQRQLGPIVAEIGPGDNFGVALLALRDGAQEVHCIDRYRSLRDEKRQTAIYRSLAERFDLGRLFDGVPEEKTLRGVFYHAGIPAERFFRDGTRRYDAILSRAVLEHLYDPLAALDDMARSLSPGGVMVHRVDLRDHGMFRDRHPLTFLTIPRPIYRRMTQYSGRPNRVLMPAYRAWLEQGGLRGRLRIVRLVGVDEEFSPSQWDELPAAARELAMRNVAAIKARLARPFSGVPEADLAVSGFVLTVEREAGQLEKDLIKRAT
jgi:SAM-dependent methyltransferase